MPSILAPTYYGRAKGLMPERFDGFFKWFISQFGTTDECGTVESPLGWVGLVEVTDKDIVDWYESEGKSLEEMRQHMGLDEYPVDAGFYVLRQDDNGLIWAMTYGGSGTLAEESARADFAEAERVSVAWDRADDQEYGPDDDE